MVRGTNKDSVSSIYNYNTLGVLVGNKVEIGSGNLNLEPQVKLPTQLKKDFTIDYTKFIPSDLVESHSDGVSLKYVYVVSERNLDKPKVWVFRRKTTEW